MSDPLSRLKDNYRKHAIAHGTASDAGNSRRANAEHRKLHQAYFALRGNDGDQVLLELLLDADPKVRIWAGTHCLFIDERKATKTLKGLVKAGGIIGFAAENVLAEHRAGSLGPPEEYMSSKL